jgi:hypothetical protein
MVRHHVVRIASKLSMLPYVAFSKDASPTAGEPDACRPDQINQPAFASLHAHLLCKIA